ncbi:hypothetical protein I2I05_11165 [Hymenobacter sp. BT683]|uniref:DUF4279 domain-containing protein n=1 Tax=Hymenobacter jeongseonensis TaxID=2791027 RepID=A0ABS0IJ68_9BACT|nr:hypothetical protein [Hymenobacter jeongseonensis]MBF9237953.1 hypothetical protein [Hymenobacter jeongseonensis]
MSCQLRFTAKSFDVYSYLLTSKLHPHEIFKAGDYQQTILASWTTKDSGFCVTASHADFNDFEGQIVDAEKFIWQHIDELEVLGKMEERITYFFDFGLTTTLFEEDVWVQSFHFPVEFLLLLSRIGAGLEISSYYPTSEEEEENNSN